MKYFYSIISCSIGNILEWYDFGLFAIYSSLFSHLFFPATDSHTAIISTLSIFAIGFFCRPLGALIFGYMGDKVGRAKTLRLSVLMISLPTLLIGVLPTYQQIGLLAPFCLMLIRMWQGLSIGGEYSGNLIYLAETAPDQHRGVVTALAGTGANVGILLASVVGMICSYFFTPAALASWGWRIPYLISGFLSLFIYITRLRIQETGVFCYLQQHHLLADNPLKTTLEENVPFILRTLGLVCLGSTYYYFCFVYIPVYLSQHFSLSLPHLTILMTLFIFMMIILVPLAGLLCDVIGRRKMLLFNAIFITLCVVPGLYLLQQNNLVLLILTLSVFTIASSLEQATTSIAIVENFPPKARYSGLSLGYNLGNGLLGGSVPLVCAWLSANTSFSLAPACYIALCAILTGIVVFFFVPETRNRSLTQSFNKNQQRPCLELINE